MYMIFQPTQQQKSEKSISVEATFAIVLDQDVLEKPVLAMSPRGTADSNSHRYHSLV